ncbi:MAG TPA: dienelactone hydrolase family protein [Acidobacteriota bacterium]|nr:dienelactone hydrolase family protein [Acidobacteriota bacterium]
MNDSKRALLYSLLGKLPDRSRPISVERPSTEEKEGYLLETLRLDLNGLETVPAYFLKPLDASGPGPTILYNHAHGGEYSIGKSELIEGRSFLAHPPYADDLTRLGYRVLCIDAWCFGERSHRTEMDTFKEMLWTGSVLWGMMVYDSLRAVDYLVTRPDVDPARIGTLGMSMGSTLAWWLAALDERIAVCVDICCLTDFQSLIDQGSLKEHGIYYFVPSLLNHFSTADINRLIVPRPHLSLAGIYDPLTPVEGLDRIDDELRSAYRQAGVENQWRLLRYETGHQELPEMRKEALDFLQRYL